MNKKRWPGWKLRLPPQHRLIETGPVDAIASYYSFFIGAVLRTRLRWALDKLPDAPLSRVLEVGYGSGVLLPSLVQGTGMAVGIDIHPNAAAVHQALTDLNIPSYLIRGDATALPFTQRSFAAVLIVSALEFIQTRNGALRKSGASSPRLGAWLLSLPGRRAGQTRYIGCCPGL